MNRRRLLARVAGVAGVSSLSGCLSSLPTSTDAGAGDCDGDPFSPVDVVEYDPLGGFSLAASEQSVLRGEALTVQLRNESDGERTTGNPSKYTVHRRDGDEWRSIYRTQGSVAWTDEGIIHPPDEGFDWTLTLTRSGLAHELDSGSGSLTVCGPVDPGEYRFVYWGLTTEREREADFETEYGLGARFTVTES